jgi:hypothetical protein
MPRELTELQVGERYRLRLEGGLSVEGLIVAASGRSVSVAPPDIVPWSAHLCLPRESIYAATRLWIKPPRRDEPGALEWEQGPPWLTWKPGTEPEPEPRRKRRRKATAKPLLPDALESEPLVTSDQ